MSEEILKALMQLFGLLTKQDGGVGSNETEYVRVFLKQQLNTEAVEEYFALFLKHSGDENKDEGEETGKVRLTSMKDSVRKSISSSTANKKSWYWCASTS